MKTNRENKPHPHAELIKAWADGAEIQHFDTSAMQWKDCKEPNWFIQSQYRIKPEEPSNDPWKPRASEVFWFVNEFGAIDSMFWSDDRVRCEHLYSSGNCFPNSAAGKKRAAVTAERVKAALKGDFATDNNVGSKSEIDGKPLTDGEVALIKALRNADGIYEVFKFGETRLVANGDDGGMRVFDDHIAFLPNNVGEHSITSALEQIQSEQGPCDAA